MPLGAWEQGALSSPASPIEGASELPFPRPLGLGFHRAAPGWSLLKVTGSSGSHEGCSGQPREAIHPMYPSGINALYGQTCEICPSAGGTHVRTQPWQGGNPGHPCMEAALALPPPGPCGGHIPCTDQIQALSAADGHKEKCLSVPCRDRPRAQGSKTPSLSA